MGATASTAQRPGTFGLREMTQSPAKGAVSPENDGTGASIA
jgi:hypothetical protein